MGDPKRARIIQIGGKPSTWLPPRGETRRAETPIGDKKWIRTRCSNDFGRISDDFQMILGRLLDGFGIIFRLFVDDF